MKALVLLVLLLGLGSCAYQPTLRDPRPQPGVADPYSVDAPTACHDSLFLALQNKPYSQLTAYEHAYFDEKWKECNGIEESHSGSTPEWILAIISIIGVAAALIIK